MEQGQGFVCWTCGGPRMKKECPNKGKAFISKSTFESDDGCEHCGVQSHDIDHCYSLHSRFRPNETTDNKDGEGKKGHERGNYCGMAITQD